MESMHEDTCVEIESYVDTIMDSKEYVEQDDNIYIGKTEEEKKKKYKNEFMKKGGMLLIHQDFDIEGNRDSGFSNPVLSDGFNLNQEVKNYQEAFSALDCQFNDNDTEKRKLLIDSLNHCFQIIAGYYSRYEHIWHEKIGNAFKSMQEFSDFYYDLLRDCLIKFDFNKYHNIEYENDFRKANKDKNYFNQYFYQALSLRRITQIKKSFNTSKNPYVHCEVCGEKVTKITDYHLKHEYDHHRIKREFKIDYKVKKTKFGKKLYYDECSICGEKDVTVDHVKQHCFAEPMTVNDYIEKYPTAKLSAFTVSLQSPIGNNTDGQLTLEDVYSASTTVNDLKLEESFIFDHIDDILSDDPFLANVLKCKYMGDTNKDIAMKLGDTVVVSVPVKHSSSIKNKSSLFKYIKEKNLESDFTDTYGSKFGIVQRFKDDSEEHFTLCSISESKISSALVKLRKDKKLIGKILCK